MTSSNGKIFRITGLCAGTSQVSSAVPAQRPVTWSFDIFFDLHLNKQLSKQWWGWWFETSSCSLWGHCNETPYRHQRHYNNNGYTLPIILVDATQANARGGRSPIVSLVCTGLPLFGHQSVVIGTNNGPWSTLFGDILIFQWTFSCFRTAGARIGKQSLTRFIYQSIT